MLGQKARNKGAVFGAGNKLNNMVLSKILSVDGQLIRFACTKKAAFMISLTDKPLVKTENGQEVKQSFLNAVAEVVRETTYSPRKKSDFIISSGDNAGKRRKGQCWTEPVIVNGKPRLLVVERVKIEGNSPYVSVQTYDPAQDNENNKVKETPERKVTLKGDVE